ncbi:MAG: membrane protein insertion efficiency factor YidD, partial [Gammaproteobacteria bacterium]|nr:membrane protein insertion efficiency factor YidD [Gammaproteobacteria bacterium]
MSRPLSGLVGIYRATISPLLGMNCRFEPTCSDYAQQALAEYGAWRGGWLACRRIARCHPWGGSGYDPLPVSDADEDSPRPAFSADTADPKLLSAREHVLNHAYALISRGNRNGGYGHIGEY